MELKELKVTYEELFKILGMDIHNYEASQYVDAEIYVETPTGMKQINGCVVKEQCEMYNFKFVNNIECNVADTHIFSDNGNEVFAKDINIGDFVDSKFGRIKIVSKEYIGTHDGFDINIDYPHWYYNPDGIIYHNTLMMTGLIADFIKQGKNILLVSMEMSALEIVKRVDANVLNLPINSLTKIESANYKVDSEFNTIKEDNTDIIREAFRKVKEQGLGKFYTKAYAPGTFSAMMLDDLLNTYETEQNIKFDLVFLDYIGIMKSDRLPFSAGLYNYVKSIAEEVRAIAVKRDLPVISASQLNRSSVNNLDSDNSAVADSIGTVQTADFLCFMLQTEELKARNEIHFKITKNRFNGRTDSFTMMIDYTHMKFYDCVQIADPSQRTVIESEISTQIQEYELKALESNKNSLDSWDELFDDLLKS